MIEISVPGSKSITNRALIAAALSGGKSKLKNALESDDTKFLKRALGKIGGSQPLFCGNAGTAVRFLTAVLATQPFRSVITGDARMQKRPIQDLLDALKMLGADVRALKNNGCPPVSVAGPLLGGICKLKGNVSSQFLSGLLLAAPLARNDVTIIIDEHLVSKPYVDLTLSVMAAFGIRVKRNGYKKFFIKAGQKYRARNFEIEGDASSASYFWGISALTGEPINAVNVPKNSLQADIRFLAAAQKLLSPHPLPSATISHHQPLTINCSDFPDSAMTLAVLSAFRKGKTILAELANLRVKECDRLHALASELKRIGCRARELPDGIAINGNPEKLHPAKIKTYNDHRMAMCFGMASVALPGLRIENPGCVRKTYPNFWKDLARVKSQLQEKNLVLTGMRGSGKSRIGALLGRALGRRFIDIDDLIEEKEKKSISEIVSRRGWKYFRLLEQKTVQKLASIRRAIIATGGGTLMDPRNAKILKQNSKIVFLECPVKIMRRRIGASTHRPSLTGKKNFLDELAEIYEKRKRKYEAVADAIMDVSRQTNRKRRDFEFKRERLIALMKRWGMIE
ncbi:3-phosphoshikimate 1-carboxyvinyltransferase [Candidatus Peregrinibacteria bacterium]|nr:3-phosphoshikimate 1-carboxyvinyltransferase [Candidatus Peregrinibacteria bacterium]